MEGGGCAGLVLEREDGHCVIPRSIAHGIADEENTGEARPSKV